MTANKNFIDFVIEAKDNEQLYEGFLRSDSAPALKAFFEEHHFDVSAEDCEKLMHAKEEMGIAEGRIPPAY